MDIKLPVPPKQWCETNTNPTKKLGNLKESQIASSTKLDNHTKIPPFVPLQAVRQQKNKQIINKQTSTSSNNENNTYDKNSQINHPHSSESEKRIVDEMNKPKRERKIRIAAKFPNSMTN